MHIGLFAPLGNPFGTPDYVHALGTAAEERGFHSIWVAEHVVLFDDYASSYPYAADGRIPAAGESRDARSLHALVVPRGRHVAHPARDRHLPRSAAQPRLHRQGGGGGRLALGGRLDFGVGVGWLEEEFRALQVPFDRRGDRCREYLEVMRRLWCDPVSSFAGEFYELARVPPVPEADPATASADPFRRRERRGAASGRRSGPGLVPLRHAAGRRSPSARDARPAPGGPRRGRSATSSSASVLLPPRRPRPGETLSRRRRRSGDSHPDRSPCRRAAPLARRPGGDDRRARTEAVSHAAERPVLRVQRRRQARPPARLRALVRARARSEPARHARGDRLLPRERLLEIYRELDLGLVLTLDQTDQPAGDPQVPAVLELSRARSRCVWTAASTAGPAARWSRSPSRACRRSRDGSCTSSRTAPAAWRPSRSLARDGEVRTGGQARRR